MPLEAWALIAAMVLPCPSGGCQDPANRGEGCVFVRSEAGRKVECSYCERPGDPEGRYEADDAALSWFYELEDASEGFPENLDPSYEDL